MGYFTVSEQLRILADFKIGGKKCTVGNEYRFFRADFATNKEVILILGQEDDSVSSLMLYNSEGEIWRIESVGKSDDLKG